MIDNLLADIDDINQNQDDEYDISNINAIDDYELDITDINMMNTLARHPSKEQREKRVLTDIKAELEFMKLNDKKDQDLEVQRQKERFQEILDRQQREKQQMGQSSQITPGEGYGKELYGDATGFARGL